MMRSGIGMSKIGATIMYNAISSDQREKEFAHGLEHAKAEPVQYRLGDRADHQEQRDDDGDVDQAEQDRC